MTIYASRRRRGLRYASPRWLSLGLMILAAPILAQDVGYLSEMPTAPRIAADMKGSSTRDSDARTVSALNDMVSIIKLQAGRRALTGAEQTAQNAYARYGAQIEQAENARADQSCNGDNCDKYFLYRCEAAYEFSPQFFREVLDRYFSRGWQARYGSTLARAGGTVWRDALALPPGTKMSPQFLANTARLCPDTSLVGRLLHRSGSAASPAAQPVTAFGGVTRAPGSGSGIGGDLVELIILALIARWIYRKIRYSRHLTVRRSNREALAEFGPDQATREHNILEAFDSNNYTFRLVGESRDHKMRFVLLKPVSTFKRQDLECMRFAYFAFNRGLIDEEKFYTYRITAMYQDGMTDPSEIQYLGLLAFWRKRNKQGEINRARGAVQSFAAANCTPNLHNQTLAALQALLARQPNDEFFLDMRRRFLEGSRWLGISDIKRSAFAPPARPTAFSQQLGILDGTNTMLSYAGDGSILTIAPPGSGKTTCNVVPNLLRWPGAAVVLDVKGEIYDLTSKYRSTIGPVIRFSPLDPQRSHLYNPLAFIRRESLYVWEDASNAANMMLVPGHGGDKNKFFEDSARDVLTAIIADLAFWHKPEDRPMSRVLSILNRNGWDEFLDRLRKNPEVGAMQDMGVSLAKEHAETLANILSFARAGMSSWKGERIAMITKRSDWHPLDLRSERHPTIYICINSEEIETYASLLRVFIAQHLNVLMSQKVPAQGADPILFCLDEFPRLGGMKPIEKALEVGRGYGLRLWLFAQNFGQIDNAYANAKGLMENCLVRTFMNPTVASAAMIAEEIGKAGVASGADEQSTVSPQELAGPAYKSLQIVVGVSSKPAKVRKMPYYENPELQARVGSLDDPAHASATA